LAKVITEIELGIECGVLVEDQDQNKIEQLL